MFVDEAGALWLSNPWIAIVLLSVAVGLVMWCHRWLENGKAPLPRYSLLVLRDGALRGRRIRQRQAVRPAVISVSRLAEAGHPAIRTMRTRRSPSSAA